MPVNPNEAQAGFMAVECDEHDSCDPCALAPHNSKACREADCSADSRADGCFVLFIKRPGQTATANFPHDDMGTPVE